MNAPRYLLLVATGAPLDRSLLDRIGGRLGQSLAFEAQEFAFFASDATILPVGTHGAIIGSLFHRYGAPRSLSQLDDGAAGLIVKGGLSALSERFWGSYVAILEEEEGWSVFRDPSGALPCYHGAGEGFAYFASDPDLIVEAGLLSPAIEWGALARILYSAHLPQPATALASLDALLPGTAVTVGMRTSAPRTVWTPWDHVIARPRRDMVIEEVMHRVVANSVVALARDHSRILLGLSGGLDSSIVAACVARTGAQLFCQTMRTADPLGDERLFARLVCEAVGASLGEGTLRFDPDDLDRSFAAHLPRPTGRTQGLSYARAMQVAARELGIDAFFSGNGGDNVFGHSQSATSIVDRLIGEGPGLGTLRTLRDVCHLNGCGAVQAMRAAWRVWRRPTPDYVWRPETRFLHPDVVAHETRRPLAHPWLDAPADALPGKAAHIAALLRAQNHLEGYDRRLHPPLINPLMSQPVVETCLAIPSWQWCEGGRDRAVARRAFARDLPQAVIERRSKGSPDGLAREIVRKGRDRIRDRLLGGTLAAQGLLDLDRIDRALRDQGPDRDLEPVRILTLVDCEAWIAHWRRP